MEIPINTKVICSDGNCGHITCVVIDPITDELTHVVVEDDSYPYEEHIVPVDLFQERTSDSLGLACNRNEFLQMDKYFEHRYIHVDKVHGVYPASRHVYLPYGWPIYENFADIKHERIPPGEITFHRGAQVFATDGLVGKVDEFLIEPNSGHITHLIMREGHIWDKKEVAIPVSQIDSIKEDEIYLKLDKEKIISLPTISVNRLN
jgi:sporulation protein YlmC with PRC-barrel domain